MEYEKGRSLGAVKWPANEKCLPAGGDALLNGVNWAKGYLPEGLDIMCNIATGARSEAKQRTGYVRMRQGAILKQHYVK